MLVHRSSRHALILGLALAVPGCASSDGAAPDGEPGTGPSLPEGWPAEPFPLTEAEPEAQVALGRLLFYDPIVSSDRETACATCHSEVWGMADGLPRSIGAGAGLFSGPGRNGKNLTRRNAPTLWNARFETSFFWDGRAASLEEQVHFPFAAAEELARPYAEVVADVAATAAYAPLFEAAFPDADPAVSETTLAEAIASFERTLVSKRGLYDAYVGGDERALDAEGKRGLFLFAELGCATCHVPPLFSSDGFADRGVTEVAGSTDRGRAEITGDDADDAKFKIPTLRNLRETAPFFHTGEVASVEEAVRLEAARSAEYDGARPISEDETKALAAFVKKALFDRQHNPTRPKDVPSGLPVPIDGFDKLR